MNLSWIINFVREKNLLIALASMYKSIHYSINRRVYANNVTLLDIRANAKNIVIHIRNLSQSNQSHVWYIYMVIWTWSKVLFGSENVAFYLSMSLLNVQFSILLTPLYVGFPAERKHLCTNSESENDPSQSIHCLIVPGRFQ